MEKDVMNGQSFYHTIKPLIAAATLVAMIAIFTPRAHGQSETIVYKDDVARQRLLIRLTAHYIHTAGQGQIDMDSAVRIPCKVYGLSPLLAYNEAYSDGKPSPGTRLLDAGNVKEARALLAKLQHDTRLRLLIELGSYLVFKPGAAQEDLDEASTYIQEAVARSANRPGPWKLAGLTLQAFLFHQSGLTDKSQQTFTQIIALCEQTKNQKALAQTLLSSGRLLPYGHPSRLANFEKARSIFQTLREDEKEIETNSEITIEYFVFKRYEDAEKSILHTLQRQLKINYRHQQYAYDALAYISLQQGDLPSAMDYSNKTLASLTTREDSVFAPYFYARRGGLHENLHQYEDALYCYDKTLENRSNDTRLFWYNSVFGKARLLNTAEKHPEALSLLREIERQFPPITTHEKMHFALRVGETLEALKKWPEAEEYYKAFLTMAQPYPLEYIHGEFAEAHWRIAGFYRTIGKTSRARALLDYAKPSSFKAGALGKGMYYEHLFKIDSADNRYVEAINDLQLSKKFLDSALNYEQKKKVDELLIKYEAEKKDRNIQLLKQQTELQNTRLQQSQFAQRMTIVGAGLLLLTAALLYYLYWSKQKSNKQLKHLVSEKEWLLKEVHHRVKNNLQTVLSLLESQSRKLTNEAFDAIQESQNRVYAMSLIHKKLYQSTDVASIDMEDYLRDLIQHLRESFGQASAIRFTLRLDPINLDVSQAVPVGLIVNEAITNAIKYAFPEKDEDHEVFVSLNTASDKVELVVADNGVGMAQTPLETTKSLGLKLMQGLTEDIDGFFTLDTKKGVTIRIRFVPNVPLPKINLAALPTTETQSA